MTTEFTPERILLGPVEWPVEPQLQLRVQAVANPHWSDWQVQITLYFPVESWFGPACGVTHDRLVMTPTDESEKYVGSHNGWRLCIPDESFTMLTDARGRRIRRAWKVNGFVRQVHTAALSRGVVFDNAWWVPPPCDGPDYLVRRLLHAQDRAVRLGIPDWAKKR